MFKLLKTAAELLWNRCKFSFESWIKTSLWHDNDVITFLENVQLLIVRFYQKDKKKITHWVRGESHIGFRTQCVIITLGGWGGLSLVTLWNSENLSNFKAHELSWTVNKLFTRILRVFSSCPAISHIYR